MQKAKNSEDGVEDFGRLWRAGVLLESKTVLVWDSFCPEGNGQDTEPENRPPHAAFWWAMQETLQLSEERHCC